MMPIKKVANNNSSTTIQQSKYQVAHKNIDHQMIAKLATSKSWDS